MPSLIAFVFGSMVGSFLNVCILRLPKEESVVFPSSHCPGCQKAIAPYDNIPVLSFFILRGRCRHCQAGISRQYPLIEALTGGLFVLFYLVFGVTPKGVLYLVFSLGLLVQTVIDMRYRIIPDSITLPGIVISLIASTVFPGLHDQTTLWAGLLASLKGLLLGGGFLYAVGSLAEWILKKEAMGGGDVKLLAALGAGIGWRGVVWTIFVSALAGSVVGIYNKLKHGDELIPYGPFLALGAFTYFFVGPQVIKWYFGFLRGI